VDDRVIDAAALGTPLAVDPGRHEVVLVTASGRTQKTIELVAGGTEDITLTIQAPEPEPVVTPEATSSWSGPDRKMMAYIAGGVGVVGLGTFGIFGALSNGHFDRLESGCADQNPCDADLEGIADQGQTYQTVANVSFVIGLVGIGAGAGLYLWDMFDTGAASEPEARVFNPQLRVGLGTMTVSGRF